MLSTRTAHSRSRRGSRLPTRVAGLVAVSAFSLGGLTACGEDEQLATAEQEGTIVGDAVQAQSEEAGTDITTAISEQPWAGESDAYVTGTYDFLVVNIRTGACAKLVFDSDEPGADYEIAETSSCGEVGDDVG